MHPRRHAGTIAALLMGALACLTGVPRALFAQDAQEPPPRIRVAVEVIPVDVQVLDRLGRPVPNLGPDKFTVTINGKRRRVLSADQITRDAGGAAAGPGSGVSAVPGRVIMLAIDCISFDATASRDVINSVGQFMRGLQPDDYVGLSAYPNGPQLAPTTDHAAVLRALGTVVGQRDGPTLAQFNLRPSEIIDMSRDISLGTGPTLDRVLARECGEEGAGPTCRFRLVTEVTNTALYYEGQATASLGMLRTLVGQMRGFPGRKTLILVSGGMIASDAPGGRPDLGALGTYVGREAAAANTAIYTLYVDSTLHDQFAAEKRLAVGGAHNQARDRAVLARWLEQFTGTAGGALFDVQVGNAQAALARIHTELSSYYLLGVEPADEDRNGRVHEVSVKIRESGLTIRGRRWVMIPKPGAAAAPAAADASAATPPAPPPAPEPPPTAVPQNVAALARIFDRGDGQAFQAALDSSADLSNAIRGFRVSDSPWPGDPRRTAIFALELAVAGLRSGARDTREEAGRLLAEFHVRIRTPGAAEAFECGWLAAEAAALEGLFSPENAQMFIARALQRCPSAGRLHLAAAVVSEQQWLRGVTTPEQEADVLTRYERARDFRETAVEARVRAARFLHGLRRSDRALAMLQPALKERPSDGETAYFAHLVHGLILRAAGRMDEAAAAFRSALEAWPGAQSARVALMALLVARGARGDRDEAASLAEAIQTAPADDYDPWWMYWLGDYRLYPTILAELSGVSP